MTAVEPQQNHEELAAIQRAYAMLQQRDGAAESRARQWKIVAFALVVITLGVGMWDHLDRRGALKVLVQTVQVNDDGKVQHVGEPQELMSYEPLKAHWYDMLHQWVIKTRWRSGEPIVTKRDWQWAYLHTCGNATRLLKHSENTEKPFQPSAKLVSIQIKSITDSPAPKNYQVLWSETTVDASSMAKTQHYTGTFVVGRYHPPTQEAVLQNRLGLCVTAFDISLHSQL